MKTYVMKAFRPVSGLFRGTSGFSLIELMSVMAIFSILAAASFPSVKGVMDSYNICGAADLVESQIALARQSAMSRNIAVEVRIYRYNDGNGDAWRAMALVIPAEVSGRATDEWVTQSLHFPGSIILEDSSSYSSVLTAAQPPPAAGKWTAPWSGTESSTTAPRALLGKKYVSFRFQPNGSTNLPSDKPWCLTLKPLNSKPVSGRPAPHFVSLVVDSMTGRTSLYQP
ncbi:MAG: Verru_Chthon cassette protein D [Candidatus Methylacidiphilales bacterium]|nr:Verru_Chthon cassette protein D [Candidatus Methylacidiphilales bacterium]